MLPIAKFAHPEDMSLGLITCSRYIAKSDTTIGESLLAFWKKFYKINHIHTYLQRGGN